MFNRDQVVKKLQWTYLLIAGAGLVIGLLSVFGAQASTEGMYVGQDFYTPSAVTQVAARSSGFTRLFLYALHVNTNGDIAYNDIPMVQDGIFLGDPNWATTLAALRVRPTTIDRLEATIGGPDDLSYENIKRLVATQGTGSNSVLYKNLLVLKDATGVDAIQLDDEQTYDVPSTVAFGRMIAGMGMKVTLRPYTAQDFWVNVKAQLGTNVDAVYLQCYDRGAGNDPGAWNRALGFKVYPGLWAGSPDSPSSVTAKFRNWQTRLGITGGFIWLNGAMPEDAPRWAQAMSFGLDSFPSFRIVNQRSGKSMGVFEGGGFANWINAQYSYTTMGDQQWSLVPTEDGNHYKIISWYTGKCISIALDSMLVGGQAWLWDYKSDPSQQFELVNTGNGWFKIRNVRSRLVLEVVPESTENYAVVQQRADTGASSQLWKLYPYREANTMLAYDNIDCPDGDLSEQPRGNGWRNFWMDGVDAAINPTSGKAITVGGNGRFERYFDCSINGNFGIYGYIDANGNIGADGKTLYLSFLEPGAGKSPRFAFELIRGSELVAGIGRAPRTGDDYFYTRAGSSISIHPANAGGSLYVMRIDFLPGNDTVRVYCNPASATEPAEPILTLPGLADLSFNGIAFSGAGGGAAFKHLPIRLANSWQYAIGGGTEFVLQPSSNLVSDDIFRHVRIGGQVLYGHGAAYYLVDGNTGVHVLLSHNLPLEPGDVVDVMGVVQRKNQFVELIEATARKIGHLPLPPPGMPGFQDANRQSPWVWVDGTLTGFKDDGTEQIMELQTGSKNIVARLPSQSGAVGDWPVGSRLKLTGVYVLTNGNQMNHENVDSFELLLNSPVAVEVIARPLWWTLKRVMVVVALMVVGLVFAILWIGLLRRQVELRTVQLGREFKVRQQLEQKRVVEEERSRIARDIHDELGSTLTEISMLATDGPELQKTPELFPERMGLILERARSLIISLDGVVWAVNPENDTLASLVVYLAAYTEEYLARTNIACRIYTIEVYPAVAVAPEMRNNLLLAVKEAINNAVRHGHPSQVSLKLAMVEDRLEIRIEDNGGGFDQSRSCPGNGLRNLEERMRKSGGRFDIHSAVQQGTVVVFSVPLLKFSAAAG